ncbi:unnamed protein product [Rotaria magnacalcarata]|uniref:Uncharacterized protein n=1 Tax=Rotaria magnacalcarata TaxID=392030 RepID=A0A815YNX8_9BILA|nr:unnamed protein product [Rotaria magnacalcarata]
MGNDVKSRLHLNKKQDRSAQSKAGNEAAPSSNHASDAVDQIIMSSKSRAREVQANPAGATSAPATGGRDAEAANPPTTAARGPYNYIKIIYMGNRASRKTVQKQHSSACDSSAYTSKQPADQPYFMKHHADAHCNLVDNLLNHHLQVVNSNPDIPPLIKSIHQNSFQLALRHHFYATSLNNPHYLQLEQLVVNY